MPNDDARQSNRLLNALPKEDYQRLHAHLRPHAVQQKQDGIGVRHTCRSCRMPGQNGSVPTDTTVIINPDTYTHFYTDIQMYTTTMTQPDPELFMLQFASWEIAAKDNKWQGRNITRWQNQEYDDTHKAAQVELDPVVDPDRRAWHRAQASSR